MAKGREKGHAYERKIAKEFREELGFEKCKTSRYESKFLEIGRAS